MSRKKRVVYPVKRTPPKVAPGGSTERPSTAVSINLSAMQGRDGVRVGQRVRILGTGLYAGEIAVVERLVGGVVPAVAVRTEAGRTRTVRTIDLEPAGNAPTNTPANPAGGATSSTT